MTDNGKAKYNVTPASQTEIEDLKNILENVYLSLKKRFNEFTDFQDVIIRYFSYHSDQLAEGQKPEEMVKQFVIEPIIKYLGYSNISREGKLRSPFGKRYPDYIISGPDNGDIILYVEAEAINVKLFAENKGVGQISQWLISKAAKSEYGIATDGILWILVKFDPSSNKTREILRINLRPFFKWMINPISGTPEVEIISDLEKLLLLRPKYLRETVYNYAIRSEIEKEEVTKKFYGEYVRYVFGLDEYGNQSGGTCLKDSIITPKAVNNPQRELFAVITMNRILFITFLEERNLVPRNLLTGLLELYKKSPQPRSFYSMYLSPLFYDVLNTSVKSRKSYVKSIPEFQNIAYLNGGLFRKNLDLEELYDIDNEGIELVMTNLLKYKIGLSSEAAIQPEILGYIFEKTINYISGVGKTNKQKLEGAYYTPEDVVDFIIDKTLNASLYDKMIQGLINSGWSDTDLKGYNSIEDILHDMPKNPKHSFQMLRAIDEIHVLDPACGSGHFVTIAANVISRLKASIQLAMGEVPNMYDIKRMVISRNTFGVDINEIAVEITKLRLWLSIISEATQEDIKSIEHIETLPNIDFNIVVGNSLVGQLHEKLFLSFSAMESGFIDPEDLEHISSLTEQSKDRIKEYFRSFKVEDFSNAYMVILNAYRTASGENAIAMHSVIMKIKALLYNAINQAFYSYIISYDTTSTTNNGMVWKAITSRRPLHWGIDYVNILRAGGFDVIIGNPPYIEDQNYDESDLSVIKATKKTNGQISPILYRSMNCGNTHAYFIERSLNLLNERGRFGFIVPISLISTERMAPIREVIHGVSDEVSYYNFDDRPGKIFSGIEHCRSTIVVTRKGNGVNEINTSRYHRWYSKDRPELFRNLKTTKYAMTTSSEVIPKIGSVTESKILERMKKQSVGKILGNYFVPSGKKVWYHNAPQYWIHAHYDEYVPKVEYYTDYTRDDKNQKILLGRPNEIKATDQYKYVELNEEDAAVVSAMLNSSLFYWWFVIKSDGRHLLSDHIVSLPINLDVINKEIVKSLKEKAIELMEDYNRKSNVKINIRKGGYAIKIMEIIPKRSYKKIMEIDKLVAKVYSFTTDERDFIAKFDINFRLGESSSDYDDGKK
ncbi:MAG: DNA methyltransferase [Thermoplasmataceae archaeon]